MKVIITQYGTTISISNNMQVIPRINETVNINGTCRKVKNVIWHINDIVYVEIVLD